MPVIDGLNPKNMNHPTSTIKGFNPDLTLHKFEYQGFPTGEVGAGEGINTILHMEMKFYMSALRHSIEMAHRIQAKAAEKSKWNAMFQSETTTEITTGFHKITTKEENFMNVLTSEGEVDFSQLYSTKKFTHEAMISIDPESQKNLNRMVKDLTNKKHE